MRTRDERRHQANRHMRRRLKEKRAERSLYLDHPYWANPRTMARFKEQPQVCSCMGCGNQRRFEGDTIQERRAKQEEFA